MNFSWIKTHKLISLLIGCVIFIAAIISSNSYIASKFLTSWLKEHASAVELEDLTLSFRNAELQIKGLSAKDLQGKQLTVDFIQVNWLWSDLWRKELSITQLSVDGIRLDVVANNFNPETIGPIRLENFDASDPEQVKSQSNSPWAINLGTSNISNLLLCYQDKGVDYASLQIPLSQSTQTLDICVDWDSLDLNTSLNINTEESFSFKGDITLSGFNIFDQSNNRLLSLKSAIVDDLLVQEQSVNLEKFTLNQFYLLAQNLDDTFADKGAFFEQLQVNKINWEATSKTTIFDSLTTQMLLLRLRASDQKIHQLLRIESLSINKATINKLITKVDSVLIDRVGVLERIIESDKTDKTPDYLIGLKKVAVNKVNLTEQQFELQAIALEGLNSWLIIDKEGINVSRWMAVDDEISDGSSKRSNPFNIDIGNISLEKNSKITLSDSLNSDVVVHEINNIAFNIKNLHFGENSEQPSDLNYSLVLKNSGAIVGKGFIRALDKHLELELIGKLSNLDLVKLTQHSAKFIGYRVDQGQLSVDYNVKIKENIIDADFGIFLEKFDLANLQKHEQAPTNEALGIPLPLALNLLRDSDDNISIDIPLSGDVTAPDFSLASIFTTVSVKAIKNAVIHYYSPLGMLSLASGIIDLATALRFEPILFEQRRIDLTIKAKQQLDKITKIMTDKPNVKFIICAQATFLDAPLKAEKVVGEKTDTATDTVIDHKPLIELANQRQQIVIDYLLKKESIDSSRLIGCNVKLSKNLTASTTVDISI